MNPSIAFIGAGNMASAIIGGLIAHHYPADKLSAADPLQANLDKLHSEFGIHTSVDNNALINTADLIILAVKPQIMGQLAQQIRASVARREPLVISIAAGITLASLAKGLGEDLAMIRCMPNTPALVQTGATAMYANPHVTPQHKLWANQLLSAIGLAVWVEQESQLDAVTALSGSGPAYFFRVMEAMINAGQQLGLSADLARQLTLQTALGAARMAIQSDVDAAELRRRVTSPGGTTEAALRVFEAGGLEELFGKALAAADNRSRELARELAISE